MQRFQRIGQLRRGLSKWKSESLFTAVPVPGIVGPLASLNNGLDAIKNLRLTSPIVKKSVVNACQQARQACRHVDIATGSNTTANWPSFSRTIPTYSASQLPSNIIDMMDKDQLMALMASQQTRDLSAQIEALAASARAQRAVEAASHAT